MSNGKIRRIGIKEIAAEAGVSPTTVSNVVQGKTSRLSENTVQKIQKLLEENHYVPSMGTRILSGKSSCVVGVILEKRSYDAEADLAEARWIRTLEEEIYRRGCYMLLHFSDSEEEILRLASMWNMEGIILAGFERAVVEKIRERSGRIVISSDVRNRYEAERVAGEMMGSFLINYGHNSICYLEKNNEFAYWEGIRQRFRQGGIEESQMEYLKLPVFGKDRVEYYKRNLGRAAFERKLLVFAEEYHAAEAIGYLDDMGIHVPHEVSVAGFGEDEYASLVRPALTIMKMNSGDHAVKMVEMLFGLMRKEPIKHEKDRMELIVRDSVMMR